MDIEIENYKKRIDEDFTIFPINPRLFELEKGWIINLSHRIMETHKNGLPFFNHEDRKELRVALLNYLDTKKPKKPIDKHLLFPGARNQTKRYLQKKAREKC
jgi:hypothetical protein